MEKKSKNVKYRGCKAVESDKVLQFARYDGA
jgi:hypothetical protein